MVIVGVCGTFRAHDFDDTWQTLSDVHGCNTGVVERTHGHLRSRLADGLGRDDACCFVRVDAGAVKGHDGFVDDFLCLWLGQFLLAAAVACDGQIGQNSVGEAAGPGGFNGFLELLVDGVAGKFVLHGLHLTIVVVRFHVGDGLGARSALAGASCKANFGHRTGALSVAVSTLLGRCDDGGVDVAGGFRVGFADLCDVGLCHHLDVVPLAVVSKRMSEVFVDAQIHELLLGCTLDDHQFSPPSCSADSSHAPMSSSSALNS